MTDGTRCRIKIIALCVLLIAQLTGIGFSVFFIILMLGGKL